MAKTKEKKVKLLKVIHIDATNRTVMETTVSGLKDMQALVGGLITLATRLPNGDDVMVDDEGLLKGNKHGFAIDTSKKDGTNFLGETFAGNGFVIGDVDRYGNSTNCKSSIKDVTRRVTFLGI